MSDFNDFLFSYCNSGIHLITGDFNIHVNDKHRNETKILIDILKQNNFTQLVSESTHTAGATLDLVLINDYGLDLINNIKLNNSDLKDFSDHFPIIFNIDLFLTNSTSDDNITIKTRKLENLDIVIFKQKLFNSHIF